MCTRLSRLVSPPGFSTFARTVVMALAIGAEQAAAAPILYDEVSGDAPSTALGAIALGALPLGDADVLGSIRNPAVPGPLDVSDYYAFEVAPGRTTTATVASDSFGIGFLNVRLLDSSDNMIDVDGVLGDQVVPIWTSVSPIGPGSYFLELDGNNDRKDYRVTFTTISQTVPEPAAVTLLGLALAGVACRRSRRRPEADPLPVAGLIRRDRRFT